MDGSCIQGNLILSTGALVRACACLLILAPLSACDPDPEKTGVADKAVTTQSNTPPTTPPNTPPKKSTTQENRPTPPERTDGPMLFIAQPKVDFGNISDLDEMTANVTFINNGSRVLEVIRVQPTCGCTTTKLAQNLFGPGEGDSIELKFKPKTSGRQSKIVKVHTNDPLNPIQNITIVADVTGSITVSPRSLSFGRVPLNVGAVKQVTLTGENRTYEPGDVSFIGKLSKYASAHITKEPNPGDSRPRWRVDVVLSPDMPWGWHPATMKIEGKLIPEGKTEQIHKSTTVGVNASVQGDLRASDTMFRLMMLEQNRPILKTINLSHAQGKPFQLIEAKLVGSTVPNLQVAVVPIEGTNGAGYELTLMGDSGNSSGPIRGEVAVKTDIPGEENISLGIAGSIRKPGT